MLVSSESEKSAKKVIRFVLGKLSALARDTNERARKNKTKILIKISRFEFLKMASKREAEDEGNILNKRLKSREKCMFGDKCYRRNPHHFSQFEHPHLENLKTEPEEPHILKEQYQILKELNLLKNDSTRQEKLRELTPSRPTELVQKEAVEKVHPLVQKFRNREPFNFFFTKVKDVSSTHKDGNSVFLTDLLHSCHGNLKSTVQINFLIDYEWLRMSYEATGKSIKNSIGLKFLCIL